MTGVRRGEIPKIRQYFDLDVAEFVRACCCVVRRPGCWEVGVGTDSERTYPLTGARFRVKADMR